MGAVRLARVLETFSHQKNKNPPKNVKLANQIKRSNSIQNKTRSTISGLEHSKGRETTAPHHLPQHPSLHNPNHKQNTPHRPNEPPYVNSNTPHPTLTRPATEQLARQPNRPTDRCSPHLRHTETYERITHHPTSHARSPLREKERRSRVTIVRHSIIGTYEIFLFLPLSFPLTRPSLVFITHASDRLFCLSRR